MNSKTRGSITGLVVVLIAVTGFISWLLKPRAFHGDSKRADASVEATANLENLTNKRGAVAAASVVEIGKAAATSPASPEKDFITQEVPVALANLPAPDAKALIEAERRKVAVMEGRVDESRKLYDQVFQRANQLEKERAQALLARQAVDAELSRVAAERLGEQRQRDQIVLAAVALLVLYLYTKFTHVSAGALAEAVTDIKTGKVDPILALDGVTSRFQQKIVSFLSHLKSRP